MICLTFKSENDAQLAADKIWANILNGSDPEQIIMCDDSPCLCSISKGEVDEQSTTDRYAVPMQMNGETKWYFPEPEEKHMTNVVFDSKQKFDVSWLPDAEE